MLLLFAVFVFVVLFELCRHDGPITGQVLRHSLYEGAFYAWLVLVAILVIAAVTQ